MPMTFGTAAGAVDDRRRWWNKSDQAAGGGDVPDRERQAIAHLAISRPRRRDGACASIVQRDEPPVEVSPFPCARTGLLGRPAM
jgi:hypothetical protein